jgi:hypothetical protein
LEHAVDKFDGAGASFSTHAFWVRQAIGRASTRRPPAACRVTAASLGSGAAPASHLKTDAESARLHPPPRSRSALGRRFATPRSWPDPHDWTPERRSCCHPSTAPACSTSGPGSRRGPPAPRTVAARAPRGRREPRCHRRGRPSCVAGLKETLDPPSGSPPASGRPAVHRPRGQSPRTAVTAPPVVTAVPRTPGGWSRGSASTGKPDRAESVRETAASAGVRPRWYVVSPWTLVVA